MFEYENELLIVDEFIYDPSLPNACVIRINDKYYMINNSDTRNIPIKETSIRPYKKKVSINWLRMNEDYQFLMAGMIPRGGFNVSAGRPITSEELKELCEKYGLTDDEISKEFESRIGSIYGPYSKDIKSIQIKVSGDKAILLETNLKEKGIEAANVAQGRVNIRTDWGGYREGAGRKPTGRKLVRIYATEEEEQLLRNYLNEIRKSLPK